MGSIKVFQGTYGFVTAIYDTALYDFFVNAGGIERAIYENLQPTTLGNDLISLLTPYKPDLHYTFLHNLAGGELDPTSMSTWVAFSQFFGNLHYAQANFNTGFEPFYTGADRYIKIEPRSNNPYTPYVWYSNDGTTTFGLQNNAPYGYVNRESNNASFAIGITVFNDDGSLNRTAVFSSIAYAGKLNMWAAGANNTAYIEWYDNLQPYVDNADPYNPGRTSTHGGGGRSFDDSSDPVGLPVPSTDYALNSGFLTMYQVNASKLNDLASFMWNTSLFDTNTWQKIMANPFDAIISLTAIPANPGVLSDRAIKIGNVVTNVSAPVVADQFVRINCGTLDVEEYSGSYLDYSPYTKIEIYLPYIGFRELNTDEVMDKTLSLVYNVDVLSGACVANILVGDTVLYQFAGDCAMQIPVTGRDPAKTLTSVLGVVTSAGSLAGGAILGTLNPQSAVKAVTATAESVIGGKRNIQRSGNISGSAGFMGGQTPYLIITRPRQALPEEQNLFMGYPSFITSTLGDLSGMTIVADCHLENIPCTDGELQEIERLLKEGVIL